MKIFLENNSFYYEIEKLTKMFFPNTKLEEAHGIPSCDEQPYVYAGVSDKDGVCSVSAEIYVEGFNEALSSDISENADVELAAADLLYKLFVKYTGVTLPWGLLTGVRPIKLFRKLKEERSEAYAVNYFREAFHVSEEKTALAVETERTESKILKLTSPESFSLYIAVPFCPSRCSYCSFVSASTEKTKRLIEPYTELLCRELEKTAEIVGRLGLRLESVYMGGGTPTTLSADQMSRVLKTVRDSFDLGACREFTVEAGRPDTITEEKLEAMRSSGADRISINPQTLSDEVLALIGRRHSSEDVYCSFEAARRLGFDHINMDLIAGLPGDTSEGFRKTLNGITGLSPESITIHTLAMKRASNLSQNGKTLDRSEAETAADMISYADRTLHACGYHPYYLYRQSRMVGNLENTGWSVPSREGYYNVFIMEETQSIIACGAGAVTKLCSGSGAIERIFNYKYPYEYINSFEQVLSRKEGIGSFYDKSR